MCLVQLLSLVSTVLLILAACHPRASRAKYSYGVALCAKMFKVPQRFWNLPRRLKSSNDLTRRPDGAEMRGRLVWCN
ncbi:hypothetical protein C8Q76DRAFT_752488 [Earliella scabrosa]|nr:hypothetical protein C8Q76DRAFT_752488 [Earliella scabrosa]